MFDALTESNPAIQIQKKSFSLITSTILHSLVLAAAGYSTNFCNLIQTHEVRLHFRSSSNHSPSPGLWPPSPQGRGAGGEGKAVTKLTASVLMLVRAAIDAASQRVYPPTRLNHEPVSVILSIAVNFRIHSWETACARPVLISTKAHER